MSSKRLSTVSMEVSWSNIQDSIASMLYALGKGKIDPDQEIMSIKLDYAGGYVAQDKVIPVEVILKKRPLLKRAVIVDKKGVKKIGKKLQEGNGVGVEPRAS